MNRNTGFPRTDTPQFRRLVRQIRIDYECGILEAFGVATETFRRHSQTKADGAVAQEDAAGGKK